MVGVPNGLTEDWFRSRIASCSYRPSSVRWLMLLQNRTAGMRKNERERGSYLNLLADIGSFLQSRTAWGNLKTEGRYDTCEPVRFRAAPVSLTNRPGLLCRV